MDHPYIKSLVINDCFAHQNFRIDVGEVRPAFKHIVLTGKNGSGKTTILRRISHVLSYYRRGQSQETKLRQHQQLAKDSAPAERESRLRQLKDFNDVIVEFDRPTMAPELKNSDYVLAFFVASRGIELEKVSTVTTEDEFVQRLKQNQNPREFAARFKQYLVNKKVYEAFDYMDGKPGSINQNYGFFSSFTNSLRSVFKDPTLELHFERESFEFFLRLQDGRKLAFDQLSDGFSAFLSILMDLFMRTDLIKRSRDDYSFDVPGYVLIDEPETHFHLDMQYEILPLISTLFPRIQLLIATHSPAIISSLENAVVFDLSSKSKVQDWLLGSSYSELMIRHFGLSNEFSPIADRILREINVAVAENDPDRLRDIIVRNERFLTSSLRLEIESRIIDIESTKSQA